MVNLDTQRGRLQAIKLSFRKANADEKFELMKEALDSLGLHAIALGLKVSEATLKAADIFILFSLKTNPIVAVHSADAS